MEYRVVRGSRLCGGVRYEVLGALHRPLYCHCSMCRKAHGRAFRARAGVKTSEFRFVSSEDLLTYHESSPGNYRGFCRQCGSPILSRFDFAPEWLGLPLGALDDDPGVKPQLHVYVGSKAPWFDISDNLVQHQGWPPQWNHKE